ncbi:MAG: cold-shock protein [Candidatus Dadabacteria bacterium]|nr:cold-shock protein [Candidatus Dadabacteria bacterium]
MLKGKVKWFNNAKGYGFLENDGGDGDVFVHYSVIEGDGYKTLLRGEVVEFKLEEGQRGPLAVKVLRAEGAEQSEQVQQEPEQAEAERSEQVQQEPEQAEAEE